LSSQAGAARHFAAVPISIPASTSGSAALAPEILPPLARLGQRRSPRPPPLPGSLCADYDGFSLQAKVLVPVGELERLEHLCRYITRPPLATQRLALAPNGRVIYGLKRHWRDGTSAVSFDPLTFIERLAALVPPPRAHQLAYHGVLATASAWRDLVVPKRARHSAAHPPTANPRDTLGSGASPAPGAATRSRSSRSTWAELLRRVFAVDVLTCPLCGGPRRLIAQLTDPVVVRKILGSSRTAHRASTARAGPLARTARLRLSRPHPHAAKHAPRPRPRASE
jgi:hypothetical protein